MALVVYGPIVQDARKKIGGIVCTKGHAGNFIRKKVSPIQPRSATQRSVRSNFSANSKAWAAGLSGNIAGWNALAKATPMKDRFGASVTLTGLQLYQRLSRNLSTIGQPAVATPPASLAATAPGALTAVATVTSQLLTVTEANSLASSEYTVIYAGAAIGLGRRFVGKNYRFVKAAVGTGSAPTTDITTAYTALFGALKLNTQIHIMVKHITTATGASGQPAALLKATVAA